MHSKSLQSPRELGRNWFSIFDIPAPALLSQVLKPSAFRSLENADFRIFTPPRLAE